MLQFTDSNQNDRICPILQTTDKGFFFLKQMKQFFFNLAVPGPSCGM